MPGFAPNTRPSTTASTKNSSPIAPAPFASITSARPISATRPAAMASPYTRSRSRSRRTGAAYPSAGAAGSGVVGRQESRQVGLGDQHLARLRALVAGDDAAPLEHVDQAASAGVADAQAAAGSRHPAPLLDDDQAGRG